MSDLFALLCAVLDQESLLTERDLPVRGCFQACAAAALHGAVSISSEHTLIEQQIPRAVLGTALL